MLFLLRLLALALFIYSVSLVFTSNFNMGNLLVWLLTAAVDVYAIWQQPIHHWLHGTIPGKIVFVFLLVFGVLYAALLGFVAFSGYANPATGQEKSCNRPRCWSAQGPPQPIAALPARQSL